MRPDLPFSEKKGLRREPPAQNYVPILCVNQFAKLLRSFSRGVEAAHEASHAGAREVVDRNMVIFKPLQHTDVRQPKCASAFQRDSDFQSRLGGGSRLPGSCRSLLRRTKRREQQKEHKCWQTAAHGELPSNGCGDANIWVNTSLAQPGQTHKTVNGDARATFIFGLV